MKELEAVMKYWHRQETEAMFKAQEATAAQRAEAFLRTIGKWEGS